MKGEDLCIKCRRWQFDILLLILERGGRDKGNSEDGQEYSVTADKKGADMHADKSSHRFHCGWRESERDD